MAAADGPWDLLVIGGGTAGIVGSKTAARLGARVALVERERTGGECLWTGCVPSKSLIAAAGAVADARRAAGLGVRIAEVTVDFAAVMAHVRRSIGTIEPADSPEALQAAGVTVMPGVARFTGRGSVTVDGRQVRFWQALLATGGRPMIPPVPGLAEAEPLTSDTVWNLAELPRRLVVLGAGSIGCELSQAFARLGADVTLVEVLPRILAREDPDAVAVPYDALLVAAGRRPGSGELGLDTAGVATDERGFVVTDDRLRTSNPRIRAAGDVTGRPQFTHLAGVHANLAASNAVLGLRRRVDDRAVPRVTFTDPEVAAVGAPTWSDDARSRPRTVTRRHADVDRAVTEARLDGFARLVLDGRRVAGATVVGPRAGESLAELALAVRKAMTTSDLAGTIHAYPTYGDGPWNAAIADVQERLASGQTRGGQA